LEGECPIEIISFGKLAGQELNYSSDVDLVYVMAEGADEKDATKFAEMFTRAVVDRMGRGYLYRVDLRLRPYGAAGPVVRSMPGYESYYELYAEPWEVQALLRSRPLGDSPIAAQWRALRDRTCFKPKLSELALEQMLAMRGRIGEHADGDDLKRGTGGIRDVEFLTQVFQLLHGHDHPGLRVLPTVPAIRALEEAGFLEHADATALVKGYTFLRKLEHRTQLVGDRQTHSIPEKAEARLALAKLMDLASWPELDAELTRHRQTIDSLYRSILRSGEPGEPARTHVQSSLGPLGPAALQWFDVLPERDAFYQALTENEGSLSRVEKLLRVAPRLVPFFKNNLGLTEQLLSGEIEEPADLPARIRAIRLDAAPRVVAQAHAQAYAVACAKWMLGDEIELSSCLAELVEEVIRHCCRRLLAPFDVIALGSLGTRDFSANSDADLLLLVATKEGHREAEIQAQHFLALIGELSRLGAPIQIDLRLRPEGGKGLLVRTYGGLQSYDLDGMEMWERFALGHARQVEGNPEALEQVLKSAYGLPLTPERLQELMKMKRRIETERVKPQHTRRNVKLGSGGLSDIEWLVHLHEMRYPTALHVGEASDLPERIRKLGRAHLINAIEVDQLIMARRYLMDLRMRLYMLGQSDDLVPENPDRLDRLAQSLGYDEGNAFLAHHEQIIDGVRRLYREGMERLRA
jgi:glutamate-ammonia-ligase adenylyltransferase